MRRFWFFAVTASVFCNMTFAQPTLTPVLVEQVPGTKEVRILYDLAHAAGLSSTVSVMASRDGGISFLDLISLRGAVGSGISPGNGKEIIWEAGRDWPAEVFSTLIVRLTAHDGDAGEIRPDMVEVHGGILAMSMGTLEVGNFFIGRYEVTWRDWLSVRAWAVTNGYDLQMVGEGCTPDFPVTSVSWYDVLKWCNAKSEMEGLTPVYRVNGGIYQMGEFGRQGSDAISWDTLGNGYRLPSEVEWEFAARGGSLTNGHIYSGSDILNEVGWYWDNSAGGICDQGNGRGPVMVGRRAPNELGLYDMSGNVWEWCWDAVSTNRRLRGGAWNANADGCRVSYRSYSDAPSYRSSYGFRLAGSMDPTVFDRGHRLEFSSFTLDLTDSISSGLWAEADRYANGWSSLPWFGYFMELEDSWIYHLEHGYQYCMGESGEGIIVFDLAMQSWFWISDSLYPYFYKFGANEGWYWYYEGGIFGQRWFYRMVDRKDLQEHQINDASNPGLAPAGMVRIPSGTFTMGSPANELGRVADEPQHEVTLTHPFFLQTTEVTKAQWDAVRTEGPTRGYTDLAVGRNGHHGDASGEHPVTEVSWFDVVKWLNLKSELEDLTPCYTLDGSPFRTGQATPQCDFDASGYRLPTESEWEYAARGGTISAYSSGPITYTDTSPLDPNLDLIGWYGGNSGGNTHPVGQKQGNEWGLYDMSGNVWEWCWDWLGIYPGAVTNPVGPASGGFRVFRGGNFSDFAHACRSARRGMSFPLARSSGIGFRAARSVSP